MNRKDKRTMEAKVRKENLTPVTVQISIPSGPQWYAAFAMDVLQTYTDALTKPIPGVRIQGITVRNIQGSTIWRQRTDLIRLAMESDCTHVLFVDTDQTFPATTLRRLLHHQKPVVACNVAVKQLPSIPTARNLVDGHAKPVFTTPESKGLEQVWRIGTGIMLVDLSVMKKVQEPWFKVSWGGEEEQYGEDWWFCHQLEQAGIPIYIDHDLSWEVGHLGMFEHKHEHVPEYVIEETEKLWQDGSIQEKDHPLQSIRERLKVSE